MPRTGRPKTALILSDEEREQLLRWSRRAKSSQTLALRSRIVLGSGEGLDNKSVAARVGCSTNAVSKWRARFLEARLDGLVDEPRPGRPATITADQVEDVVVATLESTPKNATHRSRAKRPTAMACRSRRSADLEGVRAETTSRGRVQALQRPAVRGQGLRHRRPLPEPARIRRGLLRGREIAGASTGTFPTGVPDDAGHARKTHPRLRPPRHDQPVRRVQHR